MTDQTQNQNSPRTPSTNPLVVARERLQTSARELMKNLEDAVLSSSSQKNRDVITAENQSSNVRRRELQPVLREGAASIEHAFRVMFSSCTGAAHVETASEESLSDLQFQAITTPIKNKDAVSTLVTPPTAATLQITPGSNRRTSPSQRDIGEHIYAQLFHDDTTRAHQAVETTLRGTPEQDERQRHFMTPRKLSTPFPISTPPRSAPVPSQELHVPASLTFDDAISAISAHTLEAMVDSNNTPVSRSELTRHGNEFSSSSLLLPEPSSLDRITSSGSRLSLRSKGNNSRESKTTQTTESSGSSFELWQAQEQTFWNDTVQLDGWRHPHDTFTACFDENPFIQPVIRDTIHYLPGTLEEEFDCLHSDIGEI